MCRQLETVSDTIIIDVTNLWSVTSSEKHINHLNPDVTLLSLIISDGPSLTFRSKLNLLTFRRGTSVCSTLQLVLEGKIERTFRNVTKMMKVACPNRKCLNVCMSLWWGDALLSSFCETEFMFLSVCKLKHLSAVCLHPEFMKTINKIWKTTGPFFFDLALILWSSTWQVGSFSQQANWFLLIFDHFR